MALTLSPLLLVLAVLAWRHPYVPPDSTLLVVGARAALDCLRDGIHTGCRGAGFYPPLQYLVAAGGLLVGAPNLAVVHLLAVVNWASVLAMLLLIAHLARSWGAPAVERGGWAVVLAGMLPVYATATFGEALAAAVTLAACASILLGARLSLQALAFATVVITKDTAAPVAVPVAVAAVLVASTREGASVRGLRTLTAVGVGLVAGAAAAALFNVFRFGSAVNLVYAHTELHVHLPQVWMRFAAASLIAPNAGLLFFWPLALAATVAGAVAPWRAGEARRGGLAARGAGLLLLTVLVMLAIGFGHWFSPFGWVSWGPRFFVPWMPSLAVLGLLLADRELERCVPAFRARSTLRSRLLLVVVVTVLALPAIGQLADQRAYTRFFRIPCQPSMLKTARGQQRFYACIDRAAWFRTPWLVLAASRGAATPLGLLLVVCTTLAVTGVIASRDERDA